MNSMRVGPRERLDFSQALTDTRIYGRTIAVLVPALAECSGSSCGFDELHDSAINPSCGDCNGLGRTVSSWAIATIYANVRNVDEMLVLFQKAPPGARIGETFLTISLRELDQVKRCWNDKDSYLAIDSNFFRPKSIEAAGVGYAEEWVVTLAAFSPVFRANGY